MPARALMIVGTTSHAGKSLVAAAFCRLFREMGYRVAPFKAQNMANNSFVTADGGEMGRAQAGQAEAAGVEPSVEMNPVLLKPASERGSQVILRGRPVGTMPARQYYAMRDRVWQTVTESYDRLAAAYDVIVLEGAGSPVELNIRDRDIVNLEMALYAGAPSVLVADIERGGVFASAVGTYRLLREDERRLMCGTIVNKFRGDATLFADGGAILERQTGAPYLGLLPYLEDLRVDAEDSLSVHELEEWAAAETEIRLGVVHLPRISNFTDFAPLWSARGVGLRTVRAPADLEDLDAILLPGTKSTMQDMAWLDERGLTEAIRRRHRDGGVPVVGLCGGYQMLGEVLLDPQRVEGDVERRPGVGLLPVQTTFAPEREKLTRQVCAEALDAHPFLEPGARLEGYEIHSGASQVAGGVPVHTLTARGDEPRDEPEGTAVVDHGGYVLGSYLHGYFDRPEIARAFLNDLRRRRGLEALAEGDLLDSARGERERSYSRLADALREHLRLEVVLDAMGLAR